MTEYKQQCYDVPKPVCSQKPCTYAVQQENICPTCLSPGQPGPSCGSSTPCGGGSAPAPAPQPDMCGACRQQQVKINICRAIIWKRQPQVPIKNSETTKLFKNEVDMNKIILGKTEDITKCFSIGCFHHCCFQIVSLLFMIHNKPLTVGSILHQTDSEV